MTKRLLKPFGSDRADGVLSMFIICIPLFTLLLGFSINVNTSVHAKTEYDTMAQLSAETAIKAVGANGKLGKNSVNKFIGEYMRQYNETKLETKGSGACSTGKVNGVERKLPYMEIRLDGGRGAGVGTTVYTVENGEAVNVPNLSGDYKTLSATVYANSTNFFGVFGLPSCQLHKSTVSAISYGSKFDL